MIITKTIKAYAKINLYLDVTARRSDGYHEIYSVMQDVSLFDYVTIIGNTDDTERSISIACSDHTIPNDSRNIAYKCAATFMEKWGIDRAVTINIDKRIPVAAGLAGGSTDGAAVIKLLSEMYGVNAPLSEMTAIAGSIGADIPFCLTGGTCIAEGIGERLTPVDVSTPAYTILICNGGGGVSTRTAYEEIDNLPKKGDKPDRRILLDNLRAGNIPTGLYNTFEEVILPRHKTAAELKRALTEYGAESAMMSGSGPSVFGIFKNSDDRDVAKLEINKRFPEVRTFACEPVKVKRTK